MSVKCFFSRMKTWNLLRLYTLYFIVLGWNLTFFLRVKNDVSVSQLSFLCWRRWGRGWGRHGEAAQICNGGQRQQHGRLLQGVDHGEPRINYNKLIRSDKNICGSRNQNKPISLLLTPAMRHLTLFRSHLIIAVNEVARDPNTSSKLISSYQWFNQLDTWAKWEWIFTSGIEKVVFICRSPILEGELNHLS